MSRVVRGAARWFWRWRYVAVPLVIGWLVYVERVPLLVAAGRWLDVSVAPEHADYVIFLPGGPETRPFMAAALLKAGYAPQAATCRTVTAADVADGIAQRDEDVARLVFERLGVDPARLIVLPGSSSSTVGDARAVKQLLDREPQARCLVVTGDIHTRRARWTFEDVCGLAAQRLRFVSVPTEFCRPESWWRSRHGFFIYTGELVRTTAYLVLHPPWLVWPVAMLVVGFVMARRRRREAERTATASA